MQRAAARHLPGWALLVLGFLTSLGCGRRSAQPVSLQRAAPQHSEGERVSILVGRSGPVVFLLYPMYLAAGYDREAMQRRTAALGLPPEREALRLSAFHLGVGEQAEALNFDPAGVELRFERDGVVVSRALALSGSKAVQASSARAASILRTWEGGAVSLRGGELCHWTFVLDGASWPPDATPPAEDGQIVFLSGGREMIYLGLWRPRLPVFLEHLRRPGRNLLGIPEIKNAFRAESPR